jgi:hypothetical protein
MLVIHARTLDEKPIIIVQPPKTDHKKWLALSGKIQNRVVAEMRKKGNRSVKCLVTSLEYAKKKGCPIISGINITHCDTSDVIE